MANPVQLRALTRGEQRLLRTKLKELSLPARVHQRYRIIDCARTGEGATATATQVGCHYTVVYDWLRRFNQSGFATFERVPNPKGRPPILNASQLRELVDVALSSPLERGVPFSAWSVPKLAAYCRHKRLLPPVTDEWVRRLLRREGLSAQRIRTWKISHDPAFDWKKTDPGALPAPSAANRRGLLRRVGAARGETDGRAGVGAAPTSVPDAGHLSPPAGDGAIPGLL